MRLSLLTLLIMVPSMLDSKIEGASAPSTAPPFYLGFATAAAQVEGANATDGKGPSIWDTFAATPGNVYNNETPAIADDFYHLYQSDIGLLQQLGAKHFRMSISWPRIYPNGDGAVNQKGLDFYSNLVDALLAAGIEPHVTLYHWDLPQALQDRFGGWEGSDILPAFANYSETVFRLLGRRVTYWTTMNEPQSFCFLGYSAGTHAPGVKSLAAAYSCVHNVLRAHAAAVARFRDVVPHGKISINLNCDFGTPYSASAADKEAAQRKMEYMLGVFADPIYYGDYPASVKERVPVLHQITPDLARLSLNIAKALNGSCDYFALNHYTTTYVSFNHGATTAQGRGDYVETPFGPDGQLIGERAQSDWLYVVPWGLRSILNWVNCRYRPKEIQVTENGISRKGEDGLEKAQAVQDLQRVNFFKQYVSAAADAVNIDKVPVTAYFAWSLLDNFEWAKGYSERFGVVHVDFTTQERTLKDSARYLATLFGNTTTFNTTSTSSPSGVPVS